MVLGLLVGMALAGVVTVIEESLNLLRSMVVSNPIVMADGPLLVVPGVAKLLASIFSLNFISTRWTYEVDSSIQKSRLAWKFLVMFMNWSTICWLELVRPFSCPVLFSRSFSPFLSRVIVIWRRFSPFSDWSPWSVNGENLRHITITLDKNGLK